LQKLYTHKNLSCGFVILCADHNIKLAHITIKSIKAKYWGLPYICVLDDSANDQDMREISNICQAYRGKGTYSSLINLGMQYAPADWNFLIMAGTSLRSKLDQKFSYFIDNDKDILFPIVDRKYNFVEGTLNGLFINKKTYQEIGNMADNNPLEICKLMWALDALDKGCRFKAIANSKLC